MKLTKCEHGHYYDADKYPGCPYCDEALRKDGGSTIAAAGGKDAGADTPEAAAPAGPVTGWLVALDGDARGRDLRLGEGRTVLGLRGHAPAALSADAPLGARLATVVYDPAAAAFTLLPGTAQALAYLNGAAVLEAKPLAAGDIVTLGGTALVFVPFCGPDFAWHTAAEAVPPAPKAPAPKAVKPKAVPAVPAEKAEKAGKAEAKKPPKDAPANAETEAGKQPAHKRAAAKKSPKEDATAAAAK